MVPGSFARLAVVVDDFDVVAVRVEHVRGVVAGVIARAFARLAVAAVSRRGCIRVEAADVVVFARKGDVDVLRRLAGEDQERGGCFGDSKSGAIRWLAATRE